MRTSDLSIQPRRTPLWAGYLLIAAATTAADLATKAIAFATVGEHGVVPIAPSLSIMPLFNTGSAGGVMIGPYTWQINVLVTFAALVLITSVVTPLRAISRSAGIALGLVAGGALGNLLSMLTGPEGVADFIALEISAETTIVMNVADLALWAGGLMLVPVALALVKAIRAERAALA